MERYHGAKSCFDEWKDNLYKNMQPINVMVLTHKLPPPNVITKDHT